MKIKYSLNVSIISLLLQGKHLDEISEILNLDKKYLEYILKSIKSNIIKALDDEDFYIVKIIDNELRPNKRKDSKYNVFSEKTILKYIAIGKSNEEIMRDFRINEERYIHILRSIYYNICSNGTKEEKLILLTIRQYTNEMVNLLKLKNQKNSKKIIINSNGEKVIINDNGRIINTDSYCNRVIEFEFDKVFKFISIADTHFGSVFDNPDYIKQVMEYASKNDIDYIFVCGDLIEGSYGNFDRCRREYRNISSQVEHVLNDFAHDNNIKYVMLLGNHDIYSIVDYNIDIAPLLSERKDFIVSGYKSSYIKLKDEYITLRHDISRLENIIQEYIPFLTLAGHSHQYACKFNNKKVSIKVPTCSDFISRSVVNTGFIEGSLTFDENEINILETKYIDLKDSSKEISLSLIK